MPTDRAISLREFLEDPSAKKSLQDGSAESSADILIAGSTEVHKAIEWIDHQRTSVLDRAIRNKKRAGEILNAFASLENLSRDEILTTTDGMYQKWAFALLKWWLFRIVDEAPEHLPSALNHIIFSAVVALKNANESAVDEKWENIRKLIRLVDQCMTHVDEMDRLHPEHFTTETKGGLFSAYGYLEQYCKGSVERAEMQYRDAIALNDPKGYVLLGTMYRENGRFEEGTELIQDGWRNAGSFECLLVLMQDDYEMGRVGEAAEKWNILRATSFSMTQRSSFIMEFKFPRDLRLFQIEGQCGEVLYDSDLRSRVYDALSEALNYKWQDQTDAVLFQLPILQLSALELVNLEWAKNYFREIKRLLELGESGVRILRNHFEYFTSEQAWKWFIDDCRQHPESFSEEALDTVDGLNWIIHWHLSAVVKSFIYPDAIELIELFGKVAEILDDELMIKESELYLQKVGGMKSNLKSIGPAFEEFYKITADGVSLYLWSQENRDIVTSQLLSGTADIRHSMHPIQLVYIIMNVVLIELDKSTVHRYLELLPIENLTTEAHKALGQMFYSMGYAEDALYFFSQANLQDAEVIAGFIDSALDSGKSLSLAFEALARRADAIPGVVPDVRARLEQYIVQEAMKTNEPSSDYLTLMGSAHILYWNEKLGLQDLRMARAKWSLQALKRLAEYEFYVLDSPDAEAMFIELQDKTNDTRYFIDLMRIALARGDRLAAYDYLSRCEQLDSIEWDLAYLQYCAYGTDADKKMWLKRLSKIDESLYNELDPELRWAYMQYIDEKIAEFASKTNISRDDVTELLYIHRMNALLDIHSIDSIIVYFETIRFLLLSFREKTEESIVAFLEEQSGFASESVLLEDIDDIDVQIWDPIAHMLQIEASEFMNTVFSNPQAHYISDAIGHMFRDGVWSSRLADAWYALSRRLQKKMTVNQKLQHILATTAQPNGYKRH